MEDKPQFVHLYQVSSRLDAADDDGGMILVQSFFMTLLDPTFDEVRKPFDLVEVGSSVRHAASFCDKRISVRAALNFVDKTTVTWQECADIAAAFDWTADRFQADSENMLHLLVRLDMPERLSGVIRAEEDLYALKCAFQGFVYGNKNYGHPDENEEFTVAGQAVNEHIEIFEDWVEARRVGEEGEDVLPSFNYQFPVPGVQVLPAGFQVEAKKKYGGPATENKPDPMQRLADQRTPLIHATARELVAAKRVLEMEFPWAVNVIESLFRKLLRLARLGIAEGLDLPNLLIHGQTGTGKSRFARRVGEVLRLPALQVQLSDPKALAATPRSWATSKASEPLHLIARGGFANPLIVIDEIEKVDFNARHNGNAIDDLLPLLEKSTARSVFDVGLGVATDLSGVNWMATANAIDRMPSHLLNRFAVVEMELPKPEHIEALVGGIVRDLAGEWGMSVEQLPDLRDEDLEFLAGRLKTGSSIRVISRMVEAILTREMDLNDAQVLRH